MTTDTETIEIGTEESLENMIHEIEFLKAHMKEFRKLGDWNPLHDEEEFIRQNLDEITPYDGPIVAGMQMLSFVELALEREQRDPGYDFVIDAFKRPVPMNGKFRFNTNNNKAEVQKGDKWKESFAIRYNKREDFGYIDNSSYEYSKEIGVNDLLSFLYSINSTPKEYRTAPKMLFASALISPALLAITAEEDYGLGIYRSMELHFDSDECVYGLGEEYKVCTSKAVVTHPKNKRDLPIYTFKQLCLNSKEDIILDAETSLSLFRDMEEQKQRNT